MNIFGQVEAVPANQAVAKRTVSKAALRGKLAFLLFVSDISTIVCAFGIGSLIRFGSGSPNSAVDLVYSFLSIYLTAAFAQNTYSIDNLIRPVRSALSAISTLAVSAGVWALVVFFLKAAQDFSRLEFVLGLTFAFLTTSLGRIISAIHARRVLGGAAYSVVELLDRHGQVGERTSRGIDISGLFDPTSAAATEFDLLARIIGDADRVIVHCHSDRRSAWAHVLKGMNIQGEVICDEFRELQPVGMSAYEGLATLVIARGPLDLRSRALKRGFDIVFACVVLLGLLPVLGVVALAIKLESPGPVFFKQPRIGRQNRLFRVYKFRSMYHCQTDLDGARSTQRNDDRVTRVGRIIRATSIDELPQFINVILGDMSIVGPRPHAVSSRAEAQLFWEIDERYWHRHACRPGITGKAQVLGYRGATDRIDDLTKRVDADLDYLQKWSFWNDLKIIAATVRVVIHPRAF